MAEMTVRCPLAVLDLPDDLRANEMREARFCGESRVENGLASAVSA